MQSARPSSTASANGWLRLAACASSAVVALSPSGCGPRYVAAPDSPMLILEARGSVRVAMMDGDDMVEIGWVDAADLEGQTAVHYDWSAP
jgi:hypothetical protein